MPTVTSPSGRRPTPPRSASAGAAWRRQASCRHERLAHLLYVEMRRVPPMRSSRIDQLYQGLNHLLSDSVCLDERISLDSELQHDGRVVEVSLNCASIDQNRLIGDIVQDAL